MTHGLARLARLVRWLALASALTATLLAATPASATPLGASAVGARALSAAQADSGLPPGPAAPLPGETPSRGGSGLTSPDLPSSGGGFLGDPSAWATTVFQQALLTLLRSSSSDIAGLLDWLMDSSGNVISQTPPELSYDQSMVHTLWGTSRLVANGMLATVALWGGLSLIVGPHLRAPYHTAMELLPRLALGALAVNVSYDWCRFTIYANNALCNTFGAVGLPASSVVGESVMGFVVSLLALLVYLVMGLLLLIQMLTRLALIDLMLVVAPLALVYWVLPQTYAWAQTWFLTFFGTVFAQVAQVLVLYLGTGLIGQFANVDNVVRPGGAYQAVLSLLLGIAVVHLARGVPRLMPGYVGIGAGLRQSLSVTYRQSAQSSVSANGSRVASAARALGVRL